MVSEESVQMAPATSMGRSQGFQSKPRVHVGHEVNRHPQPFRDAGAIQLLSRPALCLGVDRKIDREEASHAYSTSPARAVPTAIPEKK